MVSSREGLERQRARSDAELTDLPRERMRRWDALNKSLYVASRVFMTGHLLGAHGDRALMANSVEGRYPFLDREVQEFLAGVPPDLKARRHVSKYLLRVAMRDRLPRETVNRKKKMFLAPFGTPFVGPGAPEYARDLLSPARLREYGHFDPEKVGRVVGRLTDMAGRVSRDRGEPVRLDRGSLERTLAGMAVTFVLTAQVLESQVRSGELISASARPRA